MTHSKMLAVWPIAFSVTAIVLLYWLRTRPKPTTQRDPPLREIGFRPTHNKTPKLRHMIHPATA